MTAVKHQPATPLPWEMDEEATICGNNSVVAVPRCRESAYMDDDAYIVHAANAYPKQVTAALELLDALDREHADEFGVDTAAAANRLSALLRSLGEAV